MTDSHEPQSSDRPSDSPTPPPKSPSNSAPGDAGRRIDAIAEGFLSALQAGRKPDRAALTAANPHLAPALDERLKLVELVYRAAGRPAHRPPPWQREEAKRFCCPHCGNQIQLVETAGHEITCENCGSSFHVTEPSTLSYQPAEGSRTIGRFELREPLGRGAFGFVYKAFDPELRRFVAIKVPRAGYFPTPEDEERFLREARAAARLAHPGIVRVHEISRHSGLPYLVSDYIEGVTLADRLSSGRLGFREAAELVAELADAAEYAHRHHVVHRDLKPSNVLLDSRGRPAITDFGLARNAEAEITVTLDGQVLGTPAYMSPEQARGEANRVDARSDIYSLGVILYELLTGELPFRGNRRMLLHQVLQDEPRPPRRTNDRIPRDLETICLKAMAKSPARRYASAADLADDLRRWLDRKPVRARPVGAVERVWSWCRRNPLPAALAAAVAIALLTGTIVSLHFADRAVAKAADEARERVRADGKAADAAAEARRADFKAAEARRNLYISDMHLAEQYWADGQTGPAIELLDRYLPKPGEEDLRGWEWYYQQRLCHQELRTFEGHKKSVEAIAFSPDGTLLATAAGDGVKIWEVATGREIRSLQAEAATCLAFSPDGATLATGDRHLGVAFWDVASGTRTSRISDGMDRTQDLAFTPDGSRLAVIGRAGMVGLWDVSSLTMQRSFSVSAGAFAEHSSLRSAFTNDLTRLANVPLAHGAALWDVATGTRLGELDDTGVVSCIAFSPDGRRLVACMVGEPLRIYDGVTGHIERTLLGPTEDASCIAFTPNGGRLALAGGRGTIRLWDVVDGSALRTFSGLTARVTCLRFNPDGTQMASGDETGTALIWDTSAGTVRPIMRAQERWISLIDDIAEDSAYLEAWMQALNAHLGQQINFVDEYRPKLFVLGRYDPRLDQRDVTAGQSIRTFAFRTGGDGRVTFSPDGRFVGVLSRSLPVVWNLATGQEQTVIEPRTKPPSDRFDRWLNFGFESDGTCLATTQSGGDVALLSVSTGVESTIIDGVAFVSDAVMSPDGHAVAVATGQGAIIVIDVRTRKRIFSVAARAKRLSLSGDGTLLAASLGEGDDTDESYTEEIALWRLSDSGTPRRIPGLRTVFSRLAISPDGSTLAAASREGLQLIGVETGEIRHCRGHDGAVDAVAFNNDGKRLASAGQDRTVKLWDVSSGHAVRTLPGHTGRVTDVAFSHDGELLASVSNDGTVRVYDALPWTDELAIEREACAIVEFQIGKATTLANLIERVRQRRNITDAVRQQALVFAPQYWPAEVRARATETIEPLFKSLLLKADVVASLRQNAALDDDVRAEAIRQAEEHNDDAGRLNSDSWDVVTRRDADAADYAGALRWAEAACNLEPDDGNYLNTLGVAQYRVGQFEAALATLTRSTELNTKDGTPHPSDLAFLAMVHQALGHAEEAQTLLQRLSALAKEPSWQADAETQAFLREAEQRIAPADPTN